MSILGSAFDIDENRNLISLILFASTSWGSGFCNQVKYNSELKFFCGIYAQIRNTSNRSAAETSDQSTAYLALKAVIDGQDCRD
jgi:hypothetical protein